MKKKPRLRLLAILLCITLTIPGQPILAETTEPVSQGLQGTCGTNITWRLEDRTTSAGKNLIFEGTGDMTDYDSSEQCPWYDYREEIRSVVVGEGIETVGTSICQDFTSLLQVTFSEGLKEIGSAAFAGTGLYMASFPDSIIEIGDKAFLGCMFQTITLPQSLERIGDDAFYTEDRKIFKYDLNVPGNVKELGRNCFAGQYIVSVELPNTITSLPSGCFYNTSLSRVIIPDSVLEVACLTQEDSLPAFPREATIVYREGAPFETAEFTECYPNREYKIAATDINEVTLDYADGATQWYYDDTRPILLLSDGDLALSENTDYTIDAQMDREHGKGTLTISGIGNYSGTKELVFDLQTRYIGNVEFTFDDQEFTGEEKRPTPTLAKTGHSNLTEGVDYVILGYTENVNKGTASVRIAGIGDYYGVAKKKFQIVDRENAYMNADNTSSAEFIYMYAGDFLDVGTTHYITSFKIKKNGITQLETTGSSKEQLRFTMATAGSLSAGTYQLEYTLCTALRLANSVDGYGNLIYEFYPDRLLGTYTRTLVVMSEPTSGSTTLQSLTALPPVDGGAHRTYLAYETNPAGAQINYMTETWTSSNPEVADVAGGEVYFYQPGQTTITVRLSNGAKATWNVTVEPLDITRNSRVTDSNLQELSAYVHWRDTLLMPNTDYTIRTECFQSGIQTFVVEGCGLFTGRNLQYCYDGSQNVETIQNPQEKEGYHFDGWYQDENCTTEITSISTSDNITRIYPKWVTNSYRVRYDANEGYSEIPLEQSCFYGEKYEAYDCTFYREGYHFLAWNTMPDGSGTTYGVGAEFMNLSTQNDAMVTLYAQWEADHVHKYTSVVEKEANCSEEGRIRYTCSCGDTYWQDTPMNDKHDYEETYREDATCAREGYIYYECDRCGETKTEVLPATKKHMYRIYDIESATTKVDGKITYDCGGCGAVKEEVVYRIKTVSLSKTSYTYDGKKKQPSVKVTDRSGKVISADNYKVSYSGDGKSVGMHKVVVQFKGNYDATVTKTYQIIPKGTSLKALTPGKGSVTVKWTKQSTKMTKSRITGYEVRYSLKSSFKQAKTVKATGYRKTSVKLKNLKTKKTYYISVRTYMKVSGKTYYSDWSKAKKIKTK